MPRNKPHHHCRRLPSASVLISLVLAATIGCSCAEDEQSASRVSVTVLGDAERVYDFADVVCEGVDIRGNRLDVPDSPVRAVRLDGEVVVFSSHYNNLLFSANDSLDTIKRVSCESALQSGFNADASAYADREWLVSPYVHAQGLYTLVHNEYWGGLHDPACAERLGSRPPWSSVCLFAGISLASGPAPYELNRSGLVAIPAYPFNDDIDRYGVRDPSNLFLNPQDGHVYFLARVDEYREQETGRCLYRAVPPFKHGWEVFTEKGFVDAIDQDAGAATGQICLPVTKRGVLTVLYNAKHELFVGFGYDEAVEEGGFFVSTTPDLINWSAPSLVHEAHNFGYWEGREETLKIYPSVLDPQSPGANFDTVGEEAYLYYLRPSIVDRQVDGHSRYIERLPLSLEYISPIDQ